MAIRAIVSDIGDVLIHFDPLLFFVNVSRMLHTEPEAFCAFFGYPPNGASTLFHRWCTGRIRPVEFRKLVCARFGVEVSDHEFDVTWRSGTAGLIESTLDVLRRARLKYQLPIVSCTDVDAITVRGHLADRVLRHFFDAEVISFEVGALKPNRLMYERARRQVARFTGSSDPSEIIFFDDRLPNVAAASEFGFHAYHCLGEARVMRAALAEHGLAL